MDINTFSASLFGLASYGLLGLWMEPQRWKQGLPAALLLIGVLPFGDHMQTFVGYPMRILTASIVRDGLGAAGISSIGIDTILVLENGVSQVDLPCSGVKSLWTGLLFLIAATWIERRQLNLRWLLTALAFAILLFVANVVRVGVLVVVGQVMNWRVAAEMLHVPLGVMSFVAACAAAVILLRRIDPRYPSIPPSSPNPSAPSTLLGTSSLRASVGRGGETKKEGEGQAATLLNHPLWLSPILIASGLIMILVYAPRPQTGLTQPPPPWEFSAELVTEPMPLRPDELAWLTRDGAQFAERRRFNWRGITGSMILITSDTWRAQHRPERCFEVYGLSLEESRTYLVAPDLPVRVVSLGDHRGHGLYSAAYWFQSATRTTDDYGARIWADLAPRRADWVMVTVLFDGVHDPQDANVQAFYVALHQSVRRHLEGGTISWVSQ
jgi:exosortase O